MAMNVGSSGEEGEVMSEMNTTPLIDVMLVLLVMIIITIPAQLHSVDLNMPVSKTPPPAVKPEVVRIDINGGGVFWNGNLLATPTELESKLSAAAVQAVQPELHVRPDRKVEYKAVMAVMAAIQRKGLTKIGLIGGEQFI